ncbi:helix-turn-helix domain-containing protein [Streptosporangium sp. NPDC050855]|uniref:helix-turn-helix domain-containing protein n=1 Tax=Streptosporangium sp. NPDC050855 TaxID=3366194 RepID=UPI0037BA328B
MTVSPAGTLLARHLQELRALTGKSLKELERVTAASDSSLSRYFSGAACPPWSVVEALSRAAGRDAEELREPWEAARRARLQRYRPSSQETAGPGDPVGPPEPHEPPEPSEPADSPEPPEPSEPSRSSEPSEPENAGGPDDRKVPRHPEAPEDPEDPGAPERPGAPEGSVGAAGPDGPGETAGPETAGPRRRRIVPILVTALGLGGLAGAGYLWSGIGEERPPKRYCPWHYVVTDGDPAPVRIADRSGANRRHLPKTYLPNEVFYVAEPPVVRDAMMQTVDGWVTQGDWIRRAQGPCVAEAGKGT